MNSTDSAALSHVLKLRFGTAPGEPTSTQVEKIVAEIQGITRLRTPSDSDWRNAVGKFCPTAGTYKYGSIDNSDLNALLAQAGKGPKSSGMK